VVGDGIAALLPDHALSDALLGIGDARENMQSSYQIFNSKLEAS